MRLGIFGGTFDPPHWGHIRLARTALASLRLEKVLWMPTADPPHKRGRSLAPLADRLDMVAAAIHEDPAFALSRVEVDRPGPHFAVDTVALLSAEYSGDQLVYLMGSDSLRDLPGWSRPQDLIRQCTLGVLRRPDVTVDLERLEELLPGVSRKLEWISGACSPVASHQVRQRVRQDLPIAELVPAAVVSIIEQRALYR
jgi:nicotinate-nucleotide adenylyltransferase